MKYRSLFFAPLAIFVLFSNASSAGLNQLRAPISLYFLEFLLQTRPEVAQNVFLALHEHFFGTSTQSNDSSEINSLASSIEQEIEENNDDLAYNLAYFSPSLQTATQFNPIQDPLLTKIRQVLSQYYIEDGSVDGLGTIDAVATMQQTLPYIRMLEENTPASRLFCFEYVLYRTFGLNNTNLPQDFIGFLSMPHLLREYFVRTETPVEGDWVVYFVFGENNQEESTHFGIVRGENRVESTWEGSDVPAIFLHDTFAIYESYGNHVIYFTLKSGFSIKTVLENELEKYWKSQKK